MSLVRTDSGAVSFGVLDLSTLDNFVSFFFQTAGDLDTLEVVLVKGESLRFVERPLLVRTPSVSVVDRGVPPL